MRSPRARVGMLTSIAVIAAGLGLAVAPAADAALRPFAPRFSINAAGDLTITGNTLMTCPDSLGKACTDARQGIGSKLSNNDFTMTWVDTDADAATTNSSSADLIVPKGAPILFAGLYWGAGTSNASKPSAIPSASRQVLFKTPGAASYTQLTADTYDTVDDQETYSSIKDVTSLVAKSGAGAYTVANVVGKTGANYFAGWSLIVVYADASQPVRAMTVFDGLTSVSSGKPVTIDVNGFKTPPTGPVRTALGVVAYEGDLGYTGDQLKLNGTALGDSVRPASNFFNSSITTQAGYFTAKVPNFKNQLGFDAGLVDATGKIANNATSARFEATSSMDQYYPTALTFSTQLFSPRFEALKTVTETLHRRSAATPWPTPSP